MPLGVLRGYASETFCYTVAEEILAANGRGKTVHVYHFGDHDPSGVNAWENFQRKVSDFVLDKSEWAAVVFKRLAVTPQQIVDLGLSTRPTKKSDTRARGFVGESVEVDAIPPSVLRELASQAITRHIDREALRLTEVAEASERGLLEALAGAVRRSATDDVEP